MGRERHFARIDSCYTFKPTGAGPKLVSKYFICGDSTHSDHLLVQCTVSLEPTCKRPSAFKMNASYLKAPKVKEQVKQMWRSRGNSSFGSKLRCIIRWYKFFCIKKARSFKAQEIALRDSLIVIQAELQDNHHDEGMQERLKDVVEAIKVVENHQAEGQRIRSRIKWKQVGDLYSKEFFQAAKGFFGASNINALEDVQGALHTNQTSLERLCAEFYKDLYAKPPLPMNSAETAQLTLSAVQDKLSVGTKAALC